MVLHHLFPTRIAQPRGLFGEPDDIDKQDGGEHPLDVGIAIGGAAPGSNFACF